MYIFIYMLYIYIVAILCYRIITVEVKGAVMKILKAISPADLDGSQLSGKHY